MSKIESTIIIYGTISFSTATISDKTIKPDSVITFSSNKRGNSTFYNQNKMTFHDWFEESCCKCCTEDIKEDNNILLILL